VAQDLYALGQIEVFLKAYRAADISFRKALAIWQLLEGPTSVDCGTTLERLADTSWRLGKSRDAESHIRHALTILQGKLPPNDPYLAVSWEMAGYIFGDDHKFPEAVDALKNALAISSASLGREHHTTIRIQRELAEAESGRPPSRIELEMEK
jgi:tetratricopeptide (TPR) repeat protein